MSLLNLGITRNKGKKHRLGNIGGAALALAVVETIRESGRPALVIAKNMEEAYRLHEELLFFSESEFPVFLFPDWETLPYDNFSPHQDIISQRIETLFQLPELESGAVIMPVSSLMQRLPPVKYIRQNSLVLAQGDRFRVEDMRRQFEEIGYHCVNTVYEHGEYAIRGSIFDLFPMGTSSPIRIELFDDEIETLRTFDAENQRTIEKIEGIKLLPAREYPLNEAAIEHFVEHWYEFIDSDPLNAPLYDDIRSGISSPGIEYYIPMFFDETGSLVDYLPESSVVFSQPAVEAAADSYWNEIQERHEALRHNISRPLLKPADAFFPPQELNEKLNLHLSVKTSWQPLGEDQTGKDNQENIQRDELPDIAINTHSPEPLREFRDFVEDSVLENRRILICAESAGRREALVEMLAKVQLKPALCEGWQEFLGSSEDFMITVAPVERSLFLPEASILLVAETQLFGNQVMQRRRRSKDEGSDTDNLIKNLNELTEGAPVVHIDHGVGRYRGLTNMEVDGREQEFLILEYAEKSKLYLPVSSLHLISRYAGLDEEIAPLHRLGSDLWQRQKKKAAEKIHDAAVELLEIYAKRASREGKSHRIPQEDYQLFTSGFPFEETPDQQKAIEATLQDMRLVKPMDRLVCGDVGFGKTEVAMRAAFVAVQNGYQVAVLVPTTLLAQQHFESFSDRFADWPVQIEVLSRFKTAKEQDAVAANLAEGKVDIVIGTHKLLQGDIRFSNLGLIIIDEEHRFGVRHKEKLKKLRTNVDILTLTATPIPRTLNMAMSGIRDLSIIATPPARRLSINTFVRQHNDELVKEAIHRELMRGGQVYYLHNEVKSIERTAEELAQLVPEARIGVAHGQMKERELEAVMSDFYHKRFNVLVCTTIIETGIDVPTANTIIMDRADKLGLAQMHQLRGRVGRSHHQAYAYLLTPHKKAMTADALKRLEAIETAEDLGAGFTLASHDMEIRGAGELLGEEQSGNIAAIGFTLYMEMLERAVKALENGEELDIEEPHNIHTEINLRIPALIPDDYLPDVHIRLVMYKRIAAGKSRAQLQELKVEMIDRFGLLPEEVKYLFRTTELRLQAEALGISKIEAWGENGKIMFKESTSVDPLVIVKLVQNEPQNYSLQGADCLKFRINSEHHNEKITEISHLLEKLDGNEKKK